MQISDQPVMWRHFNGYKHFKHGHYDLVYFILCIDMERKRNLRVFERAMVVSAKRAGLCISKLLIY